MTRRALGLAGALACALAATSTRAEPAAEPSPAALAETWIRAAYGGDTVEYWKTEWSGQELQFGVARRWRDGRFEIFVRILAPHRFTELTYLIRQLEPERVEHLYYRTPKMFRAGSKAARPMLFPSRDPLERLPYVPGMPALADVVPPLPGDYDFRVLPDTRVDGVACRTLEARPRAGSPGFDRVVTALARESGVALETAFFRGERLLRRVAVLARDVGEFEGGRKFARRRSVEVPANDTQTFELVNLMLEPELPDQLFTTLNMKAGRFPSY